MIRALLLSWLILLCGTVSASAIPSEGNFFPEQGKSAWGLQVNNIFLRDFNKVEGQAATTQYFLQASYGITSRLFLDGKIGFGNVIFKRNDGQDLDFLSGFAGGYGFRYVAYDDAEAGIKSVLGFQHISCHPFNDSIGSVTHRVIWDEWQGTWLFLKQVNKSAFYAGPQYSAAQLKYKEGPLRRRLKAEDVWGMVGGVNYRAAESLGLSFELRWGAERAVNGGIAYSF